MPPPGALRLLEGGAEDPRRTSAHCRRARSFASLVLACLLLASCAKKQAVTVPRARVVPPPAVPGQTEEGLASWYGGNDGFEGKPTASGEIFEGSKMTAAHRTLPLGTWVEVLNTSSGKTARVRINDRGPFIKGRIIDLSHVAAVTLGVVGPGVAPVRITVVEPGPAVLELSATGRWSVQIGSFASAYRAELLADKMRAAGHRVYTEPFGGLTRVKVGPLGSKPAALKELQRLEAEGQEGVVAPEV
jgi:rare lipoprotein A